MKILIENGRVIDPASGLDKVCSVALAAGRIIAVDRQPKDFAPARVIDATGCIVLPGLVDLAARMRETDVLICVPHERPARVRETHDLVLNCLCDGVDTQLLGEQEM